MARTTSIFIPEIPQPTVEPDSPLPAEDDVGFVHDGHGPMTRMTSIFIPEIPQPTVEPRSPPSAKGFDASIEKHAPLRTIVRVHETVAASASLLETSKITVAPLIARQKSPVNLHLSKTTTTKTKPTVKLQTKTTYNANQSPPRVQVAISPETNLAKLKREWKAEDSVRKKKAEGRKKKKKKKGALDDTSAMSVLEPPTSPTPASERKKRHLPTSSRARLTAVIKRGREIEKGEIANSKQSKRSPLRLSKEMKMHMKRKMRDKVGSGYWFDTVCSPLADELGSDALTAKGGTFKLRQQVLNAVKEIQDWWREVRARRHQKATILSSAFRGYVVRNGIYNRAYMSYCAVVCIQSFVRRALYHRRKQRDKAALVVQCAHRSAIARHRLKRSRAACVLQRAWKSYVALTYWRGAYACVCRRIFRRRCYWRYVAAAVFLLRPVYNYRRRTRKAVQIQCWQRVIVATWRVGQRRTQEIAKEKHRFDQEVMCMELFRRRSMVSTQQELLYTRDGKEKVRQTSKMCRARSKMLHRSWKRLPPQFKTAGLLKRVFDTFDIGSSGTINTTDDLRPLLGALGFSLSSATFAKAVQGLDPTDTGKVCFRGLYWWLEAQMEKRNQIQRMWFSIKRFFRGGVTHRDHAFRTIMYDRAMAAETTARLMFRNLHQPNFVCQSCLSPFALYTGLWQHQASHAKCGAQEAGPFTFHKTLFLSMQDAL
jgi:hypothetical protein